MRALAKQKALGGQVDRGQVSISGRTLLSTYGVNAALPGLQEQASERQKAHSALASLDAGG